ncbi:MAG: hypothetical protein A2539_08280 [Elusimicrobia bacterium RIFOXYD2_FULL_34_15]|nr:MAG: hypothetical protein A2539_08280 [Elusimicrobia bacterium RIFOXYD2_FULL_34_15]
MIRYDYTDYKGRLHRLKPFLLVISFIFNFEFFSPLLLRRTRQRLSGGNFTPIRKIIKIIFNLKGYITKKVYICYVVVIIIFLTGLNYLYSQDNPKTYRVWIWQENKDCLWKIAEKFYGDGRKWTIIYEANKSEIADPNKIFPKQRLIIP